MKRPFALALAGLGACILGAAPRAAADPVVTSATASVPKMSSQSAIVLANPVLHFVRDDAPGTTPSGVTSYSETVGTHAEHPGGPSVTGAGNINQPNVLIGRLAADSSVSQTSNVSTTPDSVNVSTSATATAQKTATVQNCCFGTIANATTAFRVAIVLAAPCHYRIHGSISTDAAAGGGGRGLLQLSGNSPDPPLTVSLPLGATASSSVSQEGVFGAGQVVFSVEITADLGIVLPTSFHGSNASAARASWTLSLSLSPDAPGSDVRWTNGTGGAFGTDANWDAQRVPTGDVSHQDNAVFDVRGAYAVDLGAARSSDRLSIRQGAVTFRNGDLRAVNTSLDRPSLVVDVGKLIVSGGVLTTNSATIGDLHSVGAEVQVTGAGSRWDCLGRLRVAGSTGSGGEGRLTITGGGTVLGGAEVLVGAGGAQRARVTVDGKGSGWGTGNIAVGYSSFAEFDVTSGAKVVSNEIHIGLSAPGSLGPICGVTGTDVDGTPSEWDGTIFRIGPNFGVVDVAGGGLVKVGDAVLGNGKLTVSGIETGHARRSRFQCSSLTVGDAQVDVEDGGDAGVTTGRTIIGPAGVSAFGAVNVKGVHSTGVPSSFETDGELLIGDGDGGNGFLFVADGAVVDCRTFAFVATGGASRGSVLVSGGSTWNVGALLGIGGAGVGEVVLDASTITAVGGDVAANSVLRGNGTVISSLPLIVHGTIAPSVAQVVGPPPAKRPVPSRAKPVAPPGGTLTIQGDLVVDSTGVVLAEAAGAQSDRLVVTGDATLDGTLVLQFRNGFAPKTGESFEVFHVDGAAKGAFASVETRGLAPGAQFDVTTTGGALTVKALNDAVALPTVSVKASAKKLLEKKAKKTKGVLTFARTGPTTAPLTVTYTTRGSAANGLDYVSVPGVVTIPAKKKSVKVTVQLVADALREATETIDVAVVPGAEYTQGLASTARIAVVDAPPR